MSDQILPPPDALEPGDEQVAVVSPGEQLRQSREAKGLTLDQLASRLNITRRHLVALEADDYQALPGVAFARGYLRNLARELGLDGNELVANYNQWVGVESPRPVTTVSSVRAQADASHPLMRVFGWLIAVLLVSASLWWWRAQMTAPVISEVVPSSEVGPVVARPAAINPAQALAVKETPPIVASEEVLPVVADREASDAEPVYLTEAEVAKLAAQLERGGPSEERIDGEASTEMSQASASEGQSIREADAPTEQGLTGLLEIDFTDECWVTLKDSTGKTRVARIYKADERLRLVVSAPAELLLGRASAVSSASFNGELLNVAEAAYKNVARLTLQLN